jgi:hypothetical protein
MSRAADRGIGVFDVDGDLFARVDDDRDGADTELNLWVIELDAADGLAFDAIGERYLPVGIDTEFVNGSLFGSHGGINAYELAMFTELDTSDGHSDKRAAGHLLDKQHLISRSDSLVEHKSSDANKL